MSGSPTTDRGPRAGSVVRWPGDQAGDAGKQDEEGHGIRILEQKGGEPDADRDSQCHEGGEHGTQPRAGPGDDDAVGGADELAGDAAGRRGRRGVRSVREVHREEEGQRRPGETDEEARGAGAEPAPEEGGDQNDKWSQDELDEEQRHADDARQKCGEGGSEFAALRHISPRNPRLTSQITKIT